MKTRSLITTLTIAAMLMAFASNALGKPGSTQDDPIVASFERDMNREAVQPKTVTRDDVDSDVLYERINKRLQTPESEQPESQGE